MANPKHVEIVKQGVDAINKWRKRHPDISLDLSGADLRKAHLIYATLSRADLSCADLRGVCLMGAELSGANMSRSKLFKADLTGGYLTEINLSRANLEYANLHIADLRGADLSGANLRGADLSGTHLSKCVFEDVISDSTIWGDVDLSDVLGLESINHEGLSTVGIDTLFKSQGKIPDVFLRGCGVPEEMIVYHHSLVGKSFEFFSCFISFTESDDDFSQRLYDDLRGAEIRCWRWKEDARWGRTMLGEVDRAIRVYDKLVVICSKDSLQAEPVIREIERALQREQRDGKEILFPIQLDDFVFSWEHELQPDLTRKTIGDFRDWKNLESY
jgi:uncharacterized protein YjbI with pentapeptide repeats